MADRPPAGVPELPIQVLDVPDLPAEPLAALRSWLAAATEAGVVLPGSMVLCTVDDAGLPVPRSIPLRGIDDRGLLITTDRTSAKARDLLARPAAVSALFAWLPVMRQVRIDADAELLSDAEADAHFERRPRQSQLNAWASRQSQVLADRRELEQAADEAERRFGADEAIPRPDTWVVVRLVPRSCELWQAGPRHLHDRLRYERDGDGWRIVRLAP